MDETALKDYIAALVRKLDVKEEMSNIPTVGLLLSVYRLGLEGKDFPLGHLSNDSFSLEKDIPAQFHSLVGQLAIIKNGKAGIAGEHLIKSVAMLLEQFKSYFSTNPPIKE